MTEKRVVIVGSSTFPLNGEIGAQVVDVIREAAPSAILTRGAAWFDQFVIRVAGLLSIPVVQFPGMGNNWQRDVDMVAQADSVLGFVSPDSLSVEKISGTQHILEVGLSRKIPVKAFTEVDGKLVWAGENGA
jgi:hypothetical protein